MNNSNQALQNRYNQMQQVMTDFFRHYYPAPPVNPLLQMLLPMILAGGFQSPVMVMGGEGQSAQGFLDNILMGSDDEYYHHILNRLLQMHQPQGPPPASSEAIASLPMVKFDENLHKDTSRCTICFEDFKPGQDAVQLPCNHLFDRGCVETWLKQHGTCPICRNAVSNDESSNSKTQ